MSRPNQFSLSSISPFLERCGSVASDSLSMLVMKSAAERDKLKIELQMTFPEDWEILLETMDAFDRASVVKVSPYVQQLWAVGVCRFEEMLALYNFCPAAFREQSLPQVIGKSSREILPLLAKKLQ